MLDECDMIFSVGGDIYTIPKNILDRKKESRHDLLVEFGGKVLRKKPYIVWGASIGPFGDKPRVKRYYFDHLKGATKIFCREMRTYDYLTDNGVIQNVELCSDPAFYISSPNVQAKLENREPAKVRIALNISPLSIREQVGENHASFNEEVVATIVDLLSIQHSEVALVPHVVVPTSRGDDDLSYMHDILNMIPEHYRNSVYLLEDAKGFLGTKDFLKTCDIVIAARMHCAVNAVCEGIPTIFLTYSQKGEGMANYIYGSSTWAVPLLNLRKELKQKTTEMLADKSNISSNIVKRVAEIRLDRPRIVELFRNLV